MSPTLTLAAAPERPLTHRPNAADDTTVLRRLVAASLSRSAADQGLTTGMWLADVRALNGAVVDLVQARRAGDAEVEVAQRREHLRVSMMMVLPVFIAAQRVLATALEGAPWLQQLQASHSESNELVVVDPWLWRPLTETVHEVLATRPHPGRIVTAA